MSEEPVEIELNPREQRLYDRLRSQVVTASVGGKSGVRDLLLLVPDLAVLLSRLLRDERVAVGDKTIALLGLGYLISPLDLMPTWLFGPLGVLDDLVVLGAAVSRIVNHVHPDVVRAHWPGQGDALVAIRDASEWSEREVGGRLRRLFGGGR